LTLADLYVLAADTPGEAIWESLTKRIQQLSGEGQTRAARLVAVFEISLAQTGRTSLRRWVEGTWLALGGPACLEDATALEHAGAYFDLLESEEVAGGLADLDEFSASVAGLYAAPDVKASPGLQVMTIHKAKGLQFDSVILPSLHKTTRGSDSPLLRWDEAIQPDGSAELLLAPINERGSTGEPIYNYLKLVESERARHESTRLLYVAATRAISRLVLLAQVKPGEQPGELSAPDRRSLLSKIWSAGEADFRAAYEPESGRNSSSPEPEPEAPRRILEIRRLPAAWKLPAPPEGISWKAAEAEVETEQARPVTFAWAGPTARHIGTVVHAMLQRIASRSGERSLPGLIRAALAAEGVTPVELDEAAQRALAAIEGTQDDEFGRWILAPHDEARSEFALSGEVNGGVRHVVIDRTFVADGARWIVDYKTSTHEGGDIAAFLDNEMCRYREQLEGYAELVRRIDSRPITLCLYFPLLQEWRKWPAGEAGRSRAASSS
jgi:ATP-dependent exoDNAse (exonuclease V) beta subunit